MKSFVVLTETYFFENASNSFRFPIRNPIRTSFWLPLSGKSTFSEIVSLDNKLIEIETICLCNVRIGQWELFEGKLTIGREFYLGNYPNPIAWGKIVQLYES